MCVTCTLFFIWTTPPLCNPNLLKFTCLLIAHNSVTWYCNLSGTCSGLQSCELETVNIELPVYVPEQFLVTNNLLCDDDTWSESCHLCVSILMNRCVRVWNWISTVHICVTCVCDIFAQGVSQGPRSKQLLEINIILKMFCSILTLLLLLFTHNWFKISVSLCNLNLTEREGENERENT